MAARAKKLVKKWRELLVSSESAAPKPQTATPARVNGHSHHHAVQKVAAAATTPSSARSPCVSPALSGASTTVITANRAKNAAAASSSLPSSASTSPGLSTSRPGTPAHSRTGSRPVSPALQQSNINASSDGAVPRTVASNKRVRKPDPVELASEPPSKRAHYVNGHQHRQQQQHLGEGDNSVSPPPPSAGFLIDGENTRDSVLSVGSATCDTIIVPSSSSRPASRATSPNYSPTVPNSASMPAAAATRRRTRQSKDRGGPNLLEQQMLSLSARMGSAGRVRTTQEIVQELSMRSHSPGLRGAPAGTSNGGGNADNNDDDSSLADESKTELMNRFFDSQRNLGSANSNSSNAVSPDLSTVPSRSQSEDRESPQDKVPDTVESIMASLPVISASEVMSTWEMVEDCDDEDDVDMEGLIPVKKPEAEVSEVVQVTDEMVDRLHNDPVPSRNGNFDHRGEFKEWHEMLTKETTGGDLLHVLPYCVIE